MIKSVNISTPTKEQARAPKKVNSQLSFCAKECDKTENNPHSKVQKLAKVIVAGVILALPVVFCKLPPEKLGPLKGLQAQVNTFLETKIKPILDKVLGHKAPPNTGLNVVR